MLGGVVDAALGTSHKSPERRAIDDRATSLFSHLVQFEFHAAPFAAEIDPHIAPLGERPPRPTNFMAA
jgi:hypothetical protein